MSDDIKARLELKQLKSQLSASSGGTTTFGRRSNDDIYIHETTVLSTWDTTNTYRCGITGKNVVGSTSPQLVVGHDATSKTPVRITSQDDEIWIFTQLMLDTFTQPSLTTATVTSSSNQIAFTVGQVWASKQIFLDPKRTFNSMYITAPQSTTYTSPPLTYAVSKDGTNWTTITDGILTSFVAPSQLYVKMTASSAFTLDFRDSNKNLFPLRVKVY